jgi:CheY-like chemotaxis protein
MAASAQSVILVVDDEEIPLTLRKLVLERAGYKVMTAPSAKEAIAVMALQEVDLVISDHLMPGLTGAELVQHLKSIRPDLPVILISGVNEIPTGAISADMFMSKVEGPAALCQNVASLLGRYRSQAANHN